MNTGDANYIKRLNRRILLEEIIKNISLSRSDLARITGLNKATVSAQVADFLQEDIVIEKSEGESITRGRKPILLEINGNGGYSIGIDIDESQMNIYFTNLKGEPFYNLNLPILDYNLDNLTKQLIDNLMPYIKEFNQKYASIGLVGVGVGIHGIVNDKEDIIFTPKQKWSNINIKDRLEEAFQTNVTIDNNANLSVFAEQVYDEHISDLFCITLYSGIGLGIISEDKIYRGYQGFAGEIGHMIIESSGRQCSCGNKGCWELYASESVLLEALKEKHPSVTGESKIETLLNQEGTEEIIENYLDYLAVGLNNIINIFNPEKIILNGVIINGNSPFINKIQDKLKSKINNYREIRASKLGKDSSALGGAALAIKRHFGLKTINYVEYGYTKK
ncbi:ROK family transcriptional regulator [Virgibacillus ainsalahensis]